MTENLRTRLAGKELKVFVLFSLLVFLAAAFATATPKEIFQGMKTIILSRDALITDYSSIAVDYLLLDKPIAFTLDDYEEYKQLRGFVFKDALAYMPGHHVFETDQLEAFFDDICAGNDRYRDDRRRLMPRMQNPTDSYCRRIAEQFEI